MANEFYALMGRMRYITRWGLMRNTFSENIAEHSHITAVLAHALALIRRDILKLPAPDPDYLRCTAHPACRRCCCPEAAHSLPEHPGCSLLGCW